MNICNRLFPHKFIIIIIINSDYAQDDSDNDSDDALPSAELLGELFGEHSEFQTIKRNFRILVIF